MTGSFSRSEGREFRDRCRAAIEAGTLNQQLFDAWCAAHDLRRVNIKTTGARVTSSSTRARILEAEATSYAALLAALPQQCRIEAKVTETQAVSSDTNMEVKLVREQLETATSTLAGSVEQSNDMHQMLCANPRGADEELPVSRLESNKEARSLRAQIRAIQERLHVVRDHGKVQLAKECCKVSAG